MSPIRPGDEDKHVSEEGELVRHEGAGYHGLGLDAHWSFIDQRWPRYREHMRPGVIEYGDAVIEPVGESPTLLGATSFPIVVGRDGALYYAEAGLEELVHIR